MDTCGGCKRFFYWCPVCKSTYNCDCDHCDCDNGMQGDDDEE